MSNKHMPWDLPQMQSLPLHAKIIMSQQRTRQWYEYWDGMVYVSFSGGKDSTVLADLCAQVCRDYGYVLYLLFINTGLEYPEIQKFVKQYAEHLRKKYCIDVELEIVRPEMRFDEVLKTHGYPVITKENSLYIRQCQNPTDKNEVTIRLRTEGIKSDGTKTKVGQIPQKWMYLIDAPFSISEKCCDVMKKTPAKRYESRTGRKPIIGTQAGESRMRYRKWLQNGCNAFDKKNPSSQPLSFWTEQDILHYIKQFNIPYASVYGDIVIDDKAEDALEGQVNLIDYLGCHEEADRLKTTGCDRTGCIFCMFGCHLEKEPNRFQRLKETHPRQYEYCIGGGEYNEQGKWQPSKEGLGIGKVLDYIGVKY